MNKLHNDDFAVQAVEALQTACAAAGLSIRGARLIRMFASAVYHLPAVGAVARIANAASCQSFEKAAKTLTVTKWLSATCQFPTVTPIVDRPIDACGCIVTFWNYLRQDGPVPTVTDLGHLLKRLHELPDPPVPLPIHQPLSSVKRAIERSRAITTEERSWLGDHCRRLEEAYNHLDFVLPVGMIHGDAWRGNLLRDGPHAVLGDWDAVSWGPREMDLLPTLVASRFGLPDDQRAAFITAYGYDITSWSGYRVLRDIRELSTITALLRNADSDRRSMRELARRIRSIRVGDDLQWTTF